MLYINEVSLLGYSACVFCVYLHQIACLGLCTQNICYGSDRYSWRYRCVLHPKNQDAIQLGSLHPLPRHRVSLSSSAWEVSQWQAKWEHVTQCILDPGCRDLNGPVAASLVTYPRSVFSFSSQPGTPEQHRTVPKWL